MDRLECDVAIIGAGTAGLAAERSARRKGAKTLLIDERFAGTTCATVGCMPSKLLIAAANATHEAKKLSEFGIEAVEPRVNGKAIMSRLRRLRDDFVSSVLKSIEDIPEDIRIKGKARFTAADRLDVDGREIVARAIVIATGSSVAIPAPFEALGDRVLTNETIFELEDLPKSLAVIGAGPLGLELAQAMARLGVHVEVFDKSEGLPVSKDETVAMAMKAILSAEFPLHLGVDVTPERRGNHVRLSWQGTSSDTRDFERVLVAIGRPPRVDHLGLEETGLDCDDHGVPVFDKRTLQCGKSRIFMAGDANSERPLLHEASFEGAVAGRNAADADNPAERGRMVPFAITFTDPPVADIGAQTDDGIVGEASYENQGRARVEATNKGLVRLFARQDGTLTGAALAAPAGDHLAHLLAWSIERGATASELLDMPFYHPTYEEGLQGALREICKATDRELPDAYDIGTSPGA